MIYHFTSCSFCNRLFNEVEYVVKSNNGPAICGECIDIAKKIIEDEKEKIKELNEELDNKKTTE